MTYRSVYEFTCTEYSSDNVDNIEREKLYYKARIDATDFNLEELLLSMEDFLRASGYDWIEPHSLNIEGYDPQSDKQMTQSEFDEFKEMLDKIGVKAPSISPSKVTLVPPAPAKTPEELADIMMGIDRTAKVHLPKDEKVVKFPSSSTDPEMIVDGYHRSQILDGLDLDTTVDMTVDFSYDENIFSEDNDFSEYQYIIKEEEPKDE
tara:strand:+ start:2946 stop:3563 length:618 start_codon:yes stop_codon:yes gene_type:complete